MTDQSVLTKTYRSLNVKLHFFFWLHFIGISDEYDNCPFAANTDQMNNDGDDIGDECDVDDDNDGRDS